MIVRNKSVSPVFRVEGYSSDGLYLTELVHAQTADQAISTWCAKGRHPIDVRSATDEAAEAHGLDVTALLSRDVFAKTALPRRQAAEIARGLAPLLEANLPVDEALAAVSDQAQSKSIAHITQSLRLAVADGADLSHAMSSTAPPFPPVLVAMAQAGEASGRLDRAMSEIASYLDNQSAVTEQVKTALIYPAILLLVSIGAIGFLLAVVIPTLIPLLSDRIETLPLTTRWVIGASEFVRGDAFVPSIAIAACSISCLSILAIDRCRRLFDRLVLRIPGLGKLIVLRNSALIFHTLGILSRSDVPLLRALDIARDVVRHYLFKNALLNASAQIRAGVSVGDAFDATGLFPPPATRLIRAGDQTGDLAAMLLRLGALFNGQMERRINIGVGLLTPTFTIFLGGMIGTVIISVLMAVMDVNSVYL